jgi:rhamnose utilization protein RhaD (predicted bifunctional aldolase and dehydrogenase)
VCREHPNAKGAILGQHGLINWANDDKECYELTLDLIRRAQEFLDARGGKERLRRREGAVAPESSGSACSSRCCRGCAAR